MLPSFLYGLVLSSHYEYQDPLAMSIGSQVEWDKPAPQDLVEEGIDTDSRSP